MRTPRPLLVTLALALCGAASACATADSSASSVEPGSDAGDANVTPFDAADDAADSDAADTGAADPDGGSDDADTADVTTDPADATDADPDAADTTFVDADGGATDADAGATDASDASDADTDADATDTSDAATDAGDDAADASDDADAGFERPDPPPVDSLDWLSQDLVVGDPAADPYCAGEGRVEAHIRDAVGYVRTDAAGDEAGLSALAPAYNTERQRWEQRVLTTFNFRPYAESQPGLEGIPNGADVFEGEGRYVSIVGTNDSGGVSGWASAWGDGCQFFDGWISYDRTNVPDFDPDDRASWATVTSPITGVRNPTRDGCPPSFGETTTRWTYVPGFAFAAESACPGEDGPKVMATIVSDHDGGDHHEVFYFTDEYGAKTRWERWECGIPYPDHDFVTARCRYAEAQSVMYAAYGVDADPRRIVNPGGATCYLTDCRDFTTVEPIDGGYVPAAWHTGAALYANSNLLRNGDMNAEATGWDALGTTAEVRSTFDGNRYLHVSAAGTGWQSVMGTSIDEFNRFFDADGAEALLPKYLHWGARIRHAGGSGSARLSVTEWGNPDGPIIDERALAPTADWQWVAFDRLLGPATNALDVRFRLDEMTGLEVDDVYVYISSSLDR